MTIVTQLVRWGSLVVVVTVIAMTTYFIAIPFLLGDLWPEARLPLALLAGEIFLVIALVRGADGYLPVRTQVVRETSSDGTSHKTQGAKLDSVAVQSQRAEVYPGTLRRSTTQWQRDTARVAEHPSPPAALRTDSEVGTLYESLLRKAHGDQTLVERLVEYERQRNPGAMTAECLRSAIERWERDNR
jgi:hypothetical protein